VQPAGKDEKKCFFSIWLRDFACKNLRPGQNGVVQQLMVPGKDNIKSKQAIRKEEVGNDG